MMYRRFAALGVFIALASISLAFSDSRGGATIKPYTVLEGGSNILPAPQRVVVFVSGILSSADCGTGPSFESLGQYERNLLASDAGSRWIAAAAGIPADENFAFAYYGYFSEANPEPLCQVGPQGSIHYGMRDTCWSIDNFYTINTFCDMPGTGGVTTPQFCFQHPEGLPGQGAQLASYIKNIISGNPRLKKIDVMAWSQGSAISLYTFRKFLSAEEQAKINSIITFDGVLNGLGRVRDFGEKAYAWFQGKCSPFSSAYDSVRDLRRGSPVMNCITESQCPLSVDGRTLTEQKPPLYVIDPAPGYVAWPNACFMGEAIPDYQQPLLLPGGLPKDVTWPRYGQYIEVGGWSHGDPFIGGCTRDRTQNPADVEKRRLDAFIGCAVSKAFGDCENFVNSSFQLFIQPFQRVAETIGVRPQARVLRVLTKWLGSTVTTALHTPSARLIDGTSQGLDILHTSGVTFELFEIANPEAGVWSIEVYGVDVGGGGEGVEIFFSDLPSAAADQDGDDIFDSADNCPNLSNVDQMDTDNDNIGDACDADMDADGIPNELDNCPYEFNTSQSDADGNGLGDTCDPGGYLDSDSDGVPDNVDNCPDTPNPEQFNIDGDAWGDSCDPFADPNAILNRPPVAKAGPDQTVECQGNLRGNAILDGSGSIDPDSTSGTNDDIAAFSWSENGEEVGIGVQPSVPFGLGSHDVTLTVTDMVGASGADGVEISVVDTMAPKITCPPSVQVECQSGDQAYAAVGAATASDFCYGVVGMTNDRNAGGADASGSYPLGTTTVTFTATDGSGNTSSCEATVTVVDTTPPVIACPELGAAECTSPVGAFVSIMASAIDICSPTIQVQNDHTGGGKDGSGTYPLGDTSVHFTATDPSGNLASCGTEVTVQDTTPPSVAGWGMSPMFLWPPNHSMQDVAADYTATDVCSSVLCSLSVSSNEPVEGTGDGDTTPDWNIADDHHMQIRAERDGSGTGRVYSSSLMCMDASGNRVSGPLPELRVKHDMGSPRSGSAFEINSPVAFRGNFWDTPGHAHTAQWMFNDLIGTGSITEPTAENPGVVNGTYTFSNTGVYAVKMSITDSSGSTGIADAVGGVDALIVIYDPSGGYVTGGGWFDSPAGAIPDSPNLTGKVNFGFVSKYIGNATNPKGETEFGFRLADLKFNSVDFDYLMILGAKAMFQGIGKVNGDAGFSFILTVIDGQVTGGGGVDRFRIKIWNRATDAVLYDSQIGAPDNADPIVPVGAGSSIVIKP